jgi:PAS domain S-box-containing protein
MTKGKPTSLDTAELRQQAEEALQARLGEDQAPGSSPNGRRLMHELLVHEVELEIQNEELQGARLELEAGLAKYTELFEFAPLGYAMVARDGKILELNLAAAELLGKVRSRLIGTAISWAVAARDQTALGALLERAFESGSKVSCEVELAKVLNPRRQLRLTAVALPPDKRRVLVAVEDVTERNSRETLLVQAERALREADRRKDEFLAVLSHELRNPLAPIRNSLYMLGRNELPDEQRQKALLVIDRQVTHLTRLIDDLLDVTRIARGKIQLKREPLELGELVRRTLDDHNSSFEANGVLLQGHFEPGFFWVDADAARLNQAVSNLLGNAMKFTPRGGSVRVSLQREQARVALRIRDTGAGIEPSVLPTLFEPFAQAPQTMDRTRGGLGLGLAMVKGLVELHGGSVAIASEGPGRGTELTVHLPLESNAGAPAPERDVPLGQRRRVLVVEDNPDAAETLKEALSVSGHEVEVACDGPSGLERARSFAPEVVICDIGLPGMDGYEVARAFRADESLRSAYLLALSGYAQPEDLQRAKEAGFDEHVAKPASMRELQALLALAPPGAPRGG